MMYDPNDGNTVVMKTRNPENKKFFDSGRHLTAADELSLNLYFKCPVNYFPLNFIHHFIIDD